MGDPNERLAHGDQAAFAELYDLCADRLHHYLVLFLGSRTDADDVVQETFMRLVCARKKLTAVDNLVAYVFAIARNEAIRLLARRSPKGHTLERLDPCDLFVEAADNDLAARETTEVITAALARLPSDQREVVELKTFAGLTLAEVAEVTGSPLGTVATRYRTAVVRLRPLIARTYRE